MDEKDRFEYVKTMLNVIEHLIEKHPKKYRPDIFTVEEFILLKEYIESIKMTDEYEQGWCDGYEQGKNDVKDKIFDYFESLKGASE